MRIGFIAEASFQIFLFPSLSFQRRVEKLDQQLAHFNFPRLTLQTAKFSVLRENFALRVIKVKIYQFSQLVNGFNRWQSVL